MLIAQINLNGSHEMRFITSDSALIPSHLCFLCAAVYRQKRGDGRSGYQPR